MENVPRWAQARAQDVSISVWQTMGLNFFQLKNLNFQNLGSELGGAKRNSSLNCTNDGKQNLPNARIITICHGLYSMQGGKVGVNAIALRRVASTSSPALPILPTVLHLPAFPVSTATSYGFPRPPRASHGLPEHPEAPQGFPRPPLSSQGHPRPPGPSRDSPEPSRVFRGLPRPTKPHKASQGSPRLPKTSQGLPLPSLPVPRPQAQIVAHHPTRPAPQPPPNPCPKT